MVVRNQISLFGTFAESLYFLRHPVTVQRCGSDAGAEAGFTQGRTSRIPTHDSSAARQGEQGLIIWFIFWGLS